ncbi:MAG: hypothetical protein JXB26_19055 [Candidatus Aminicenantes bacterium]|nr:hypothetical protein [Candidatus Aminicenantes bacterium]
MLPLLLFTNIPGDPDESPVRTIHVFVALCDNQHQGIVQVPAFLGNGDDPARNLYWGALYGVKTRLKKNRDWKLLSCLEDESEDILERCVFKHAKENIFCVADAYRGKSIKRALMDFIGASAGRSKKKAHIKAGGNMLTIPCGGSSHLVCYLGHNGLMDFSLDVLPEKQDAEERDAVILACASKSFFSHPLKIAGAQPLLWTTGLLAPEAYILEAVFAGWTAGEKAEDIVFRAAKAYARYQGCSLRAAQHLFTTGW